MRSIQFLKSLCLLSLSLFFIASGAKAQSIVTGAVNGTVTDASGAIIANAKVTLTNESTQEIQSVSSNESGVYQFPLLKPGRYSVSVEKEGFRRIVQKTEVFLGQTATINVRMEVGETSQTVE